MPGAPPRSAASIPESSAIVASPVAAWAARALISALASKLSPVSGGSSTSAGSGWRCTPGSSSDISASLCWLRVARITPPAPPSLRSTSRSDPLLHLPQATDAHLGQSEKLVKGGARERGPLRRRLHLDQAAVAGHHHVGVDFGVGVLAIVEVAEGAAVDHADADRGDRAGQRQSVERLLVNQLLEGLAQGDEAAGDRRAAGAAVGFEHVAVDVDAAFAHRPEVDDDPQRAPDQALDLDPAPVLFALRDVALLAIAGRGGQHRVLGGDPPLAPAPHPARHLAGDRPRADHPRPAGPAQRPAARGFPETGAGRHPAGGGWG